MQVYASTTNVEEAEIEWFSEDLQKLPEPTPKQILLWSEGTGMQK